MEKNTFKIGLFFAISVVLLSAGTAVFAVQPPVANAGPDLFVASGQSIVLQGSGSDPQGYSVNYYWNCSGGTLSSNNIVQPTFTAPSTTAQTNYTCSLTVTNSYNLAATDSMIVYVNSQQVGGSNVQTNSATNVLNYQATLNGNLTNPVYNSSSYVWFQWGTDTNYGNNTPQQLLSYSGSFSQIIANLSLNTTYHFRAVAQTNGTTIYGQDMTFNSNNSGSYGNGSLIVSKRVINLSSGNSNWQTYVNANAGNILSFAITLLPSGQDIHNVYLRDILPSGLTYRGNLYLNTALYSGDITSGINIGTISANQPVVVAYQAQVSPTNYGSVLLVNNVTVTSNESGTQTASASVLVNSSLVYGSYTGPTEVATGATNNLFTDSFFLPIILITLMSYLYFTGKVYAFSDWLAERL